MQTIELKTRNQANCKEWFWERSIRITASKVGEICHFTDVRDKEKYAKDLVSAKPAFSTEAMQWEMKHEATAVKEYENISHNTVQKCGLHVCENYPFLAASPDGLVAAVTVLEVKCPYSIRNEKITPENYPHIELTSDNTLSLKRRSNYYYQCQLQMYATKREYCEFFIWTTCDHVLIQFGIDVEVVQEIIQKSQKFFNDYVVPQLQKKWFPLF